MFLFRLVFQSLILKLYVCITQEPAKMLLPPQPFPFQRLQGQIASLAFLQEADGSDQTQCLLTLQVRISIFDDGLQSCLAPWHRTRGAASVAALVNKQRVLPLCGWLTICVTPPMHCGGLRRAIWEGATLFFCVITELAHHLPGCDYNVHNTQGG